MKYKRMDEKRRAAFRTAALMIRFRTTQPAAKAFKYASYKIIAATLNLTEY